MTGRPSKYNEELQQRFDAKVERFGNLEPIDSKEIANPKLCINRLVDEYFCFGDVNQVAVYLGIIRETVYDWIKVDSPRYIPTFSNTFKAWDTKRKALLFRLSPYICNNNSALGIFLLKAQGGYLEVQRHEHTGAEGKPLPQPVNVINQQINISREDFTRAIEFAQASGVAKEKIEEAKLLRDAEFKDKGTGNNGHD